jgi:molybdopterin synthase catalytic subunit
MEDLSLWARARIPFVVVHPPDGDTWLDLTDVVIDVGLVHDWAVRPDCGAVVVFSGTVRDHADHRTGVTRLDYEAYESQVVPRLATIAGDVRARWPDSARVALLHRVGSLALGEVSVVVAVSSPHRAVAFEAARHGIDMLKAVMPIWKREHWEGGTDWGLAAQDIRDVDVS